MGTTDFLSAIPRLLFVHHNQDVTTLRATEMGGIDFFKAHSRIGIVFIVRFHSGQAALAGDILGQTALRALKEFPVIDENSKLFRFLMDINEPRSKA